MLLPLDLMNNEIYKMMLYKTGQMETIITSISNTLLNNNFERNKNWINGKMNLKHYSKLEQLNIIPSPDGGTLFVNIQAARGISFAIRGPWERIGV
jgi:hypothetical protein